MKSKTGSPHQCETNHSGRCAAEAKSSTKEHCRSTVAGLITYLAASYSATAAGDSATPLL